MAFDELEQLASEKAKIGADREQELTKEIEDLKQQLSALRVIQQFTYHGIL